MSLLLLGGTGDAKYLATELFENKINVIYSIAGLVRKPDLACKVISGGFSQFADPTQGITGLENYIRANDITEILDVTHPYAENMSSTAARVSKKCEIPYWRYNRPEWRKKENDNWKMFKNWSDLLPHLVHKSSVFLSAGQIQPDVFDQLTRQLNGKKQQHIYRTAVEPKGELGVHVKLIKAIGPFNLDDEISLLKKFKVDVIVSKNSGGNATIAKLNAARELQIPVLMLERPELVSAEQIFTDINACKRFVIRYFEHSQQNTATKTILK